MRKREASERAREKERERERGPEPTIVPIPIASSGSVRAKREMKSSGADVPPAMNVAPGMGGESWEEEYEKMRREGKRRRRENE